MPGPDDGVDEAVVAPEARSQANITPRARKIEINKELAELTKAHNAYCGSAGAVTQPTVKVL